MSNFDFDKAQQFVIRHEQSASSSKGTPIFTLLDIEFIKTNNKNLDDSFKTLIHSFAELGSTSFIRFKSEALFITQGDQDKPVGYLYKSGNTFSKLPDLTELYEILGSNELDRYWKIIELKKIEEDQDELPIRSPNTEN